MLLSAQSEWMEDQKQAVVMSPGRNFNVIQTDSGTAIFFSVGTDGVLYATREKQDSLTGWNRIDLSTHLKTNHADKRIEAKHFAVAQNPESLYFDLALIATVEQVDYLYMASGNENTDASWDRASTPGGFTWSAVPFDGVTYDKDHLHIAGVYMATLPTGNDPKGSQQCFVDIVRGTPGDNGMQLIDRFYIMSSGPRWFKQNLAIDISAKNIMNCVGKRDKDRISGMYTMGNIEGRLQLVYTPAFNVFDHQIPPSPARLNLPEGATAIASTFNSDGRSALFVSAKQGLYVFPSGGQHDQASPTLILSQDVTKEATQLSADTAGSLSAVYGANARGELFYTTCPQSSIEQGSQWTCPVPLISDMQRYAFFLNKNDENNIVFVHAKNRNIVQLTQDPVTKDWASRDILLPSTELTDVVTYAGFRTRIIATSQPEDSSGPHDILLTATSPIGVYINEQYRILGPSTTIPSQIRSDGSLSILQPTKDSVAICYDVALATAPEKSILRIDPASRVKAKLASITSKQGLDDATIKLGDGTTKSLVPPSVSSGEREAAATAIKQLVQISKTLPIDGSTIASRAMIGDGLGKSNATSSPLIAEACMGETVLSLNAIDRLQIQSISASTIASSSDNIFVRAGDLFRSIINTAWSALQDFVIQLADGIYSVIVKIGDAVYQAVLDCAAAVSHAIEWVLTKIKVVWNDIKNFLSFLFNWNDIVRTHKVIKNIVLNYAIDGMNRISDLRGLIDTSFVGLEKRIDEWAGMQDTTKPIQQLSNDSKHFSQDDPQTHYVGDKASKHLDEAKKESPDEKADPEPGSWTEALEELKTYASSQVASVTTVVDKIRKEVLAKIKELTPIQVLKKLLGIIASFVIDTAKNVLTSTLGLVKNLGMKVINGLSEPIKIPIISALYKRIADEELTVIDLICLIAAVPATLVYKAVVGSTPFPDDDTTKSLIDAKDFGAIRSLIGKDKKLYKKLVVVAEFIAMSGLFLDAICNSFRLIWMAKGSSPNDLPDTLKEIGIGVKLLVIMPNFLRERRTNDPWFMKMDAMMTDIALLKTVVDASTMGDKEAYGKVSPFIDYAISAAWMVPAIAKVAENHNDDTGEIQKGDKKSSAATRLTTALAYDAVVMLQPVVWGASADPATKTVALMGVNIVLFICAGVRVASGSLLQKDD